MIGTAYRLSSGYTSCWNRLRAPGNGLPNGYGGQRLAEAAQQRSRPRTTIVSKTGGRLVRHARYRWMMLAESHLTRQVFGGTLRRIAALPLPAG